MSGRTLPFPGIMFFVLLGGVLFVACSREEPPATKDSWRASKGRAPHVDTQVVPEWASSARWYRIAVPAFEDGNLESVRKRLPYLKDLGVNTLCLARVFAGEASTPRGKIDLRHIDDALAVKDSLAGLPPETDDPKSWGLSGSDRMFLDLVKEAHKEGFRVVLDGPLADVMPPTGTSRFEALLLQVAKRWLDPDRDGDPADGIDGWIVRQPLEVAYGFWTGWRRTAVKINPHVLLVCDAAGDSASWVGDKSFDVAIDYDTPRAIRRFLVPGGAPYTAEQFLADLTAISKRRASGRSLGAVTPLSWEEGGSLFAAMTKGASKAEGQEAGAARNVAEAHARWRLAVVLHYFCVGAPMVGCGDAGTDSAGVSPPSAGAEPRAELQEGRCKIADSREDFASLIRWLNVRRQVDAPMRLGDFRAVLADEERRVLAFARTLLGDEVILVVNYGDQAREVILQAGKPGELVGVLSPALDPSAVPKRIGPPPSSQPAGQIKPLLMGGSRQFVDTGGHVRLSVAAMSVRVVLIKDNPTG